MTREGGEPPQFDWSGLVPQLVHPLKVGIIEAMRWIGLPLSPVELERLFYVKDWYLGLISYHMNGLAKLGIVEPAGQRQRRGATETFYYFAREGSHADDPA